MSPITAVRSEWRVRVVAVVILISGLGTVVAARQGGAPALLEQIISSITTLQEGVNALLATHDSNVAFTPVASASGLDTNSAKAFRCSAVNVTDSPRTVVFEMVRGVTGRTLQTLTATIPARQVNGTTRIVAPGSETVEDNVFAYCKFTVLDGTRQDIRGALEIIAAVDPTSLLLVAAQ
jgi:hypothetical protein